MGGRLLRIARLGTAETETDGDLCVADMSKIW